MKYFKLTGFIYKLFFREQILAYTKLTSNQFDNTLVDGLDAYFQINVKKI